MFARDRVVEEVALLQHEADLPPERPVVERAQLEAVEPDRPLGRLHQAGEQLDQRRLARAAAPDDRDRLARLDRERDAPPGSAATPGRRSGSRRSRSSTRARERRHRPQLRAVAALLRLVVEHVVEPAEQDLRELELVPEREQHQHAARSRARSAR